MTLRQSIDAIDKQLVTLINARTQYAIKAGHTKKLLNVKILDSQREAVVLNRIKELNKDKPFPQTNMNIIFELIIDGSKQAQAAALTNPTSK